MSRCESVSEMVRFKIADADESGDGCLKGGRREEKGRLSYVVAATKYVRTGWVARTKAEKGARHRQGARRGRRRRVYRYGTVRNTYCELVGTYPGMLGGRLGPGFPAGFQL